MSTPARPTPVTPSRYGRAARSQPSREGNDSPGQQAPVRCAAVGEGPSPREGAGAEGRTRVAERSPDSAGVASASVRFGAGVYARYPPVGCRRVPSMAVMPGAAVRARRAAPPRRGGGPTQMGVPRGTTESWSAPRTALV
ncbi:hypothetical protein Pdca_17860 [Pseudonocardia autotrophica]|nr:hypothetical protein Pdca_17860 [Pseudonocardia autotrophica]